MEQNKTFLILNIINDAGHAVGATTLGARLNMPQTSMGRILLQMEKDGLLTKVSNKGRRITPKGRQYLEQQKNQSEKMHTLGKFIDIVESNSIKRLMEILKIRRLLEVLAVEEGCLNANESQMMELEAALVECNRAIEMGGVGNDEDLALHLTIAKISGNIALYQILRLILTDENGYAKLKKRTPGEDSTAPFAHDRIVTAMLNRDTERAKAAMLAHLNGLIQTLEDNYSEELSNG